MKLIRSIALALLLTAGIFVPVAVQAQESEWVAAEVRRVDSENARVTLRHEDIKTLDMPAMTMVFVVREPAMLAGVQVGDRVQFTVVREEGRFVIEKMKPAP